MLLKLADLKENNLSKIKEVKGVEEKYFRSLTCDPSVCLRQTCPGYMSPIFGDSEGVLHGIKVEIHPPEIADHVGVQGPSLTSLLEEAMGIVLSEGTGCMARSANMSISP